jgi:hypothetical protein
MSANLAQRIIRGETATLVAMQAELLGFSGNNRIVHLRDSTSIGVLDLKRETLVVFDGAALAALAKLELGNEGEPAAAAASEV